MHVSPNFVDVGDTNPPMKLRNLDTASVAVPASSCPAPFCMFQLGLGDVCSNVHTRMSAQEHIQVHAGRGRGGHIHRQTQTDTGRQTDKRRASCMDRHSVLQAANAASLTLRGGQRGALKAARQDRHTHSFSPSTPPPNDTCLLDESVFGRTHHSGCRLELRAPSQRMHLGRHLGENAHLVGLPSKRAA